MHEHKEIRWTHNDEQLAFKWNEFGDILPREPISEQEKYIYGIMSCPTPGNIYERGFFMVHPENGPCVVTYGGDIIPCGPDDCWAYYEDWLAISHNMDKSDSEYIKKIERVRRLDTPPKPVAREPINQQVFRIQL